MLHACCTLIAFGCKRLECCAERRVKQRISAMTIHHLQFEISEARDSISLCRSSSSCSGQHSISDRVSGMRALLVLLQLHLA